MSKEILRSNKPTGIDFLVYLMTSIGLFVFISIVKYYSEKYNMPIIYWTGAALIFIPSMLCIMVIGTFLVDLFIDE
jgi:hypothetical protein